MRMSNTVQMRWIGNVLFIVSAIMFTNATECRTPSKCCLRYPIDGKSSRCIECIPGYFGYYCSHRCRYPNYGRGCQFLCLCDVTDCDYVQGCRKKECPTGYQGLHCSNNCRYPNYGFKCQSECLCEERHCNHIKGCFTLISSPGEIFTPNTSPTGIMNQNTLMLSNRTTLTEESFKKEDELCLPYQDDKSWRVNKVFFYLIIGLSFIAVSLLCLHVVLCFVN